MLAQQVVCHNPNKDQENRVPMKSLYSLVYIQCLGFIYYNSFLLRIARAMNVKSHVALSFSSPCVLQVPVRVEVVRDGRTVVLSLVPKPWSGRGLLG